MYWNTVEGYTAWNGTGLTLTWDVLKSETKGKTTNVKLTININMRCIEMLWKNYRSLVMLRLTLTWDVLK